MIRREHFDDAASYIGALVSKYPNSYARVLSSAENAGVMSEISKALPKLSDPFYSVKTKVWWILNGISDFPKCSVCGNPMTGINVSRLAKGYPKYCCCRCMYESAEYSDSIRDAFRHKYGVDNAFQLDSVKKDLESRKDEIQAKRNASRKKRSNQIKSQRKKKQSRDHVEYQAIIASRKPNAAPAYEKFGRSSFEAFRGSEFPYKGETDAAAAYELKRLAEEQTKDQTPSRLIRSFHRSMFSCRKKGMLSPVEYWDKMKSEGYFESGEWKAFFLNRFVYADTKDADAFRESGFMSPKMALDGLAAAHLADCVSYLKPMLAKRLVSKYLPGCEEVFCPFNGFSGIMLGAAVGCGKRFVGRDLSARQISESKEIAECARRLGFRCDADLAAADVFESSGRYESLFCCPPYGDLEAWNFSDAGECVDRSMPCGDWIDLCLERFDCKKYLFVVDDKTVGKYASSAVETLGNRSHFGENSELVVLIDRS